jgi:uncharacterized protein (DUF2267 family)
MKFEEIVRKVGERAGIDDRFEAERVTVAVVQTLCDRLSGKEANDLLAQLPSALRELVAVSPSPLPLTLDEFVHRVAERLDVTDEEAGSYARAVFATLREAVTRGELQDVVAELDPEYADLL